jgi:hypothetical protein
LPPEYVPKSFVYPALSVALGQSTLNVMAVQSYIDPEGCTVTSSVNIPPAILSITTFSSDVITISPPLNTFSLIGTYVIPVTLTDFCGASSSSNLNVAITNSPP